MVSGSADALLWDADTGPCRQYDINQGDLLKFSEDLSGLVAKAGPLTLLAQRFPDGLSEKADRDGGLHTLFLVVPYGPHRQVALVQAKRLFGFGQLDVSTPEFFSAPVGHVAAQQITSLAQLHPNAPIAAFGPAQLRPALRVSLYVHLEQACGAAVVPQKSAHLLRYS